MGFAVSQVLVGVLGAGFGRRFRRELVGIWADFWKDGRPLSEAEKKQRTALKEAAKKEALVARRAAALAKKGGAAVSGAAGGKKEAAPVLWVADRPQILQRMWGRGYTLPGGEVFADILLKPMGLTSEMSLVDLSAGLGEAARKAVSDYGTYVTGYESDPDLARIGMVMSVAAGKAKQAVIAPYDPVSYEPDRVYDALVARELFYKIKKKGPFFKVVSQAVKSRGNMSFTDFIVPPLVKNEAEIKDWMAFEGDVTPLSLPELVGVWKMNNFDVRVNEDQTDFYRHLVVEGLSQFAEFLREHKPDPATVHLIEAEVEFWQRRARALDHGLRFYRFYAIKL